MFNSKNLYITVLTITVAALFSTKMLYVDSANMLICTLLSIILVNSPLKDVFSVAGVSTRQGGKI